MLAFFHVGDGRQAACRVAARHNTDSCETVAGQLSVPWGLLGEVFGAVDPELQDRYTTGLAPPGSSFPGGKRVSDNPSGPCALSEPRRTPCKQRFCPMANTSSAKKAERQMIRRTEINKSRRTRVKSEVRAVEEAIASGDKNKAESALRAAEPILVRTAQKGMMHKKTASRKVSRLAQRVKAMSS